MKKVLFGVVFICAVLFSARTVSASNQQAEIKTQEDLFGWYETDSENCYLINDIVIDEDYEFLETEMLKQIETGKYSIIFKCDVIFSNPKLKIMGKGADAPVVQLDSRDESYGRTIIEYLQVEAEEGDALFIGEQQDIETERNFNYEFPIQLKAVRHALVNAGDVSLWTTLFFSEQENAVYTEQQSELLLRYCQVNQQTNMDNIEFDNSFVGTEWMEPWGELYYEEIYPYVYVKDMNDFTEGMLPEFYVEYEKVDLDWDLSSFDVSQKENVIRGQIRINPLFKDYLDISEIEVTVKTYVPEPLADFQITDLMDMNIGTYRPYFEVTYPRGFEKVYLEVYRTEGLLYKEYDITEDIEWSYWEGETVSFMTSYFSEISADEIYYCRLRVEGGLNEGKSNFLKIHNGTVENISPFPEEPENPEEPEEPIKPDESAPSDTMGGNEGHRGAQNREETPKKAKELILTPEQISTLERTGEDVVLMIDEEPITVTHEEVEKWDEKEETVRVEATEEKVVEKDYNRKSWIIIPLAILVCLGFIYRRKMYEK